MIARLILGAAIALGVGAARADEAPPAPVAVPIVPDPTPPPNLTIILKPVPSPLHPQKRQTHAFEMGAGVYCPNFGTPTVHYGSFCTAELRIGIDARLAETHLALLIGDAIRVGGLLGFELGTPFFQLGSRHSRAALAIRGNFDGIISKVGVPIPGRPADGLLSFSNTYGPHLSVALNPRTSFEVRAAVGWTIGGFFSNHDGFDRSVIGLAAEGSVGLRFGP